MGNDGIALPANTDDVLNSDICEPHDCALTKVATVSLRVSGAVISAVPFVGNTADKVIDGTAGIIDR